jgi:integrase
MSLYRRSNTGPWWYRFEVCGVEHRASTGTGNRREAEETERRARAALEANIVPGARGRVDLAQLSAWDLERATSRGTTEAARDTLERQWLTLGRILGAFTDAARVRYGDLERFVGERRAEGARGQTISRELQTLRRGLNLARKRGKVARVPADWPEVRADAPSEKRGHLIPLDVLDNWLAALPLDAREEADVVLLTGIRAEEVRRLEWSWVEPAPEGAPLTHVLRLPASGTKNRKERIVGLPDAAFDILKRRAELAPTGPIFWEQQHVAARRGASKRIKWPRTITLRDLRHTHASLAAQATGDPEACRIALGHSDVATTQRYLSATVSRSAAAAAAVSTSLGRGSAQKVGTAKRDPAKTQLRVERATGLEPATLSLGSSCSTN